MRDFRVRDVGESAGPCIMMTWPLPSPTFYMDDGVYGTRPPLHFCFSSPSVCSREAAAAVAAHRCPAGATVG